MTLQSKAYRFKCVQHNSNSFIVYTILQLDLSDFDLFLDVKDLKF